MKQYTDVRITITIRGAKLTQADRASVSIAQLGRCRIDTEAEILDDETVTAVIGQQQTGDLITDVEAEVYVNWWIAGARTGCGPLRIRITPNEPKEVIV
jgi:hypothetical protein